MSKQKQIWEDYAEHDAYFAVATYDKFRGREIDDEMRDEFFSSGEEHVEQMWQHFGRDFRPERAIDYGCGVGRILLPLAKRCGRVTGVDISQKMLAETRRNMQQAGISNFDLQRAEEFEKDKSASYDLVHSYIVLQHIAPTIGYQIIQNLLRRLADGGSGMLHVTHTDPNGTFRRLRTKVYRDVPGVHRALNLVRGKTEPIMPMYEYDRERIYKILSDHGCEITDKVQTDHGMLGEMTFFRRKQGMTPGTK